MTREEASFYLANMDRKYMEEGMSEALDMAIEALSSSENPNKWILVSERLPEKTGIYLISIGDLVTSKSFDGHNFRTESAVRFIPDAWMPLPAPFRAESEDKE